MTERVDGVLHEGSYEDIAKQWIGVHWWEMLRGALGGDIIYNNGTDIVKVDRGGELLKVLREAPKDRS